MTLYIILNYILPIILIDSIAMQSSVNSTFRKMYLLLSCEFMYMINEHILF